jgi:transposase
VLIAKVDENQTTVPETLYHLAQQGVTQGAVSRWIARARDGGIEALRTRHPPGATPRLCDQQRSALLSLLKQGAEAQGFIGNVWTQARIAAVIKRTFGVSYHRDHIGRILGDLGWSVQKPQEQATQRNDAALAHWREQIWPAIKKKPS